MRNKVIYKILILAVVFFTAITASNIQVYADTTEDIGYYDVWLYSDGVTWQNDIKPGSTVTPTFKVDTPIDSSKTLKSYFVSFLSSTQGKYTDTYYPYAVDNGTVTDYNYLGKSKMQYTIKTTLRANEVEDGLDITKDDQAQLVKGRRFYIPVLMGWEYKESSNSSALLGWGCGGVGYSSYYYGEVTSYSETTAYWYLSSPNILVAKYTYTKSGGWKLAKVYKTHADLKSKVDRYCLATPWWTPDI